MGKTRSTPQDHDVSGVLLLSSWVSSSVVNQMEIKLLTCYTLTSQICSQFEYVTSFKKRTPYLGRNILFHKILNSVR